MSVTLTPAASIAAEGSVTLAPSALLAEAVGIVMDARAMVTGAPYLESMKVTRSYSVDPVQRVTYGSAARLTIGS